MATGTSSNDSGSESSNSPVRAVSTLLGVYTALYLAVLGAIHFATSPDAAAAVIAEVTSSQVTVTPMPAKTFGTDGASGAELIVADEPDNSHECIDGVENACIYN